MLEPYNALGTFSGLNVSGAARGFGSKTEWIFLGLLIFTCFAAPASALTDLPPAIKDEPRMVQSKNTGEKGYWPRRMPPIEAIEACEGKKEGEPCSFNAPRGILSGECLSGIESSFACRPNRISPRQDTDGVMYQRPPSSTSGVITSEEKPLHSRNESVGAPNAGLVQQPATLSNPAQKDEGTIRSHSDSPLQRSSSEFAKVDAFLLTTIALSASAITWLIFFRYSLVPLRRLRGVTQRLANGDLTARIGEGLVSRRGEVMELGRDIDRMAERFEGLVNAQQRLIRDVSHELRSPIARLNVALELARQSADPSLSGNFERIGRESDRLNELIAQLLLLTRMENVSGVMQITELDLAELINTVSIDADFEAKNYDKRVITNASEPLRINGNRELLRQAIENIIRNSIRYTEAGTSVEISLTKIKSGGRGWANIEVRDHGPGVPESELKDIFRPFYRVNDARERMSGGTGVGLAIAERAVSLHRGKLRAFNATDSGLIVEIRLPLM